MRMWMVGWRLRLLDAWAIMGREDGLSSLESGESLLIVDALGNENCYFGLEPKFAEVFKLVNEIECRPCGLDQLPYV